ncbi:hypothetical protein ACWYXN_16200 [Janthinobacterium aestuarii]
MATSGHKKAIKFSYTRKFINFGNVMRIAIALLIALNSVNAYAQDSVKTRAGDLKIVGEMNASKLKLNGKVISSGESATYGFPEWTTFKFLIKDSDVILVSDSVSATCTNYFFVTIPMPPAKPMKTGTFGTCDDGPDVKQQGDTIILRMNDSQGRRKVFKYINGKVS